jgi:small subunit ribosomal protein S1
MGQIFNSKLAALEFDLKENFPALLEEFSSTNQTKEGEVVTGTITAINNDFITVDIGFKDGGRIPKREFLQNSKLPDLFIGDSVDVYVDSLERNGEVVLSREQAIKKGSWSVLEQAMINKTPVLGVVTGRIKGGLTVDLNGVMAFLPGSQVDTRPVKDISSLLNVEQPFIVLKMDKDQSNVVVSRRAIIEASQFDARSSALSKIKVGEVYEGTIKNLTNYGAFVSLGEVDGLLHVTDIKWTKVNHPSEVLTAGQKVRVQVIKYDEETKRISLGMKQLDKNPWEDLDKRYSVGTKMSGKVVSVTDYGAFIELEPHIEGLAHVSEMTWTKTNVSPRNLVKVGDVVPFVILEIDTEKHRISLGMKQCMDNIWTKLSEKYPAGTQVQCTIEKILDYGLIVNFGEEVSGMISAQDVSWSEDAEKIMKGYKVGDTVEAQVLYIDANKERVNLSIKHLASDPFNDACGNLKRGSVVTCVVKAIEADGLLVSVGNTEFTTFIKKADLSSERIEQRPDRFAVGDRIDAQVARIDRTTRKVSLSIKALEKDEQQKKIAEYGSESSGASLGDILGQAISGVSDKKK